MNAAAIAAISRMGCSNPVSGNVGAADPAPETPAAADDAEVLGDVVVGIDVPVGDPIGGAPADAGTDADGEPTGAVDVATGRLDAAPPDVCSSR